MKKIILSLCCLVAVSPLFAQNVGINNSGATPDVSAMLDIVAADKGLLVPRVALSGTTDAVTVPTPATSLIVYNTATAGVSPNNVLPGYYYNSGTTAAPVWIRFANGNGASWLITGNAGTTAATNFLGTTDAVDLVFRTANVERARILSGGNFGIGDATPAALFTVGTGDLFQVVSTGHARGINATAALPAFSFTGDTDNGMYLSAANELSFSTAATQRLVMQADGDIGVAIAAPASGSLLDLNSTNRGLLIPRVSLTGTTDAATILTPTTSLLVYNTATAGVSPNNVVPGYYYNSGTTAAPVWTRFANGNANAWLTTGNTGTADPAAPATYGTSVIGAAENWIGTTDAESFTIGTNNIERMRIEHTTGDVGIGIANPVYRLHVDDAAASAYATFSESSYVGTADGRGVYGVSENNPGYGYGGYFRGGYMGIRAVSAPTTFTGAGYAVYGSVSGTAGSRYGGYFTASGASTMNVGGYFSATGATSNYGILVPSGGGYNGLGTTAPAYLLDVVGTGGSNIEVRNNGRYWSNSASGGMWLSDLTDCFIGNISATHFGLWTSSVGWNGMSMNKSNGYVGLGLAAPGAHLDIDDPSTAAITVYRGRNSNATGTITQIGSIEYFQDQSSTIDFTGGSYFSINLNAAASYYLHLAANSAAKPTSNAWTVISDGRLKEDVNSFKDGLSVLKGINPVYFKYNGKANIKETNYGVGVIAQDLQKVAPYMVGTWQSVDPSVPFEQIPQNIETWLSVDNGALSYVMVNAIKEIDAKQTKMVETMKNISDFGVETMNATEMFIPFNAEFKSMLSTVPVVTVTTINSTATLTLVKQTTEGFTVRLNGDFIPTDFNWVAMAKLKSSTYDVQNTYSEQERQVMLNKVKMHDAKIQYQKEQEELARRKRESEKNAGNNKKMVMPTDEQPKVAPAVNIDPDRK
ncbi:MAG TPA: tail fiber domain-containing protein [Flavobacteriales bacterium]|nr:tail fiber domain-containing protein [Flavobacteriales bacterium]